MALMGFNQKLIRVFDSRLLIFLFHSGRCIWNRQTDPDVIDCGKNHGIQKHRRLTVY
jgi:hypothetical protein